VNLDRKNKVPSSVTLEFKGFSRTFIQQLRGLIKCCKLPKAETEFSNI